MQHQSLFAAALAALSLACAEEQLRGLPEAVTPTGGLRGRLCDRTTGEWVADATITVEGASRSAVSAADGSFEIVGLEPGTYTLLVTSESYSGQRNGVVRADSVTDIGVAACGLERGNVIGRVCDDRVDAWLDGGSATIPLASGDLSAPVDQFGRFHFDGVPAGPQTVSVTAADGSGYSEIFAVQVLAYDTVTIGDLGCGAVGGLFGRICGGNGYWLSGAQVAITLADGTLLATTTDAQGYFSLSDVPAGEHVVEVWRGSFSTSFTATIVPGTAQTLPEPICIPPTTRMAVVTGTYDSIQVVLGNLGNRIGTFYSDTGNIVDSPDGNVDLIDGMAYYWLDSFLVDASWMADYQIIFLNCGLFDGLLTGGNANVDAALANLAAFVSAGGSLYASDWAAEVVSRTFPDEVRFYSGSGIDARAGAEDAALDAIVTDAGLQAALGRSDIVLNLDLGGWVVLDTITAQPPSLRVLVVADVQIYGPDFSTLPYAAAPLLVTFQYGAGRVLYTSFHNEAQTTEDMDDVLEYAIFEL